MRGHWPGVARAGWVGLALVIGALFALDIPIAAERLQQVCSAAVCVPWALTTEKVQALGSIGVSPASYAAYLVAIDTALALTYAAVAALLVWRRSSDRMASFAAFTLLTFGVMTFPESVPTLSEAQPILWAPVALLVFAGAACFSVFLFVFPDGRFVPRWTRWVALAWVVVQVPNSLISDTSDLREVYLELKNLLFLVGICAAVFAQVYRYQRVSGPIQRHQTKWTVLGFGLALGGYLGLNVLVSTMPTVARDPVGSLTYYAGLSACMALVPLSIGVAILRGRLYDVDLLINRTLVYGALTACVVGTYILVVGYLGALFQARGDAISLIAAGLAAVLFQPLRQRFQRGVNRLLYGQRDEPYAVLSRLGQRLEATLAPEAVLPTIVSTVREALKLPFVAITLGPHDAPAVVTESGTPVADPLRLALVYRGEPIGHLLLGPRALNEPFTPADRRLLEDLAHQAGVAAHAVRLTADLQRSRERLVSAREEERRRLRRDLHDGLGPALAAHTLKVGTARALLPHAAVAADRLLAELEDDIEAAVTDIRRLVYNLRPPALDELGLVGAIRESTAQYDGHPDGSPGGVVIRVEAPEWLPPLPAAVEVATYRILQEALANVFRHAQAQTCRVELRVGRALRLAVTDDGVGLSPMRHAGVGLVSMRERAEELGGSCLVEPAPGGGTRVVAELPLLPSTEELPGATWLGGSESGAATAQAAVMARR